MASKVESKIKKFLEKNRDLLGSPSAVDEFIEVMKQENMRRVKDQFSAEFTPLLKVLDTIRDQNVVIIRLLKNQQDFDAQEKRILDMIELSLKQANQP